MFCTNCGANIPDNSTVCPSCGMKFEAAPAPAPAPAPSQNFSQAPMDNGFQQNYNYNQNPSDGQPEQPKGGKNMAGALSLALGILGIVGSVLFGAMFGVPAAVVSMLISVCGMVLAITAKKTSGGGTGGLVCSIIGCALGFIMTIGCAACGASIDSDYGCYGCVGGPCKVSSDVKSNYDKFSSDFEKNFEKELENALSGINWDDFN